MLRQPVSSLFNTGSRGNCRSSSWQVAASASLLSSISFWVLPKLISMPSAVASNCSTPRRGIRSPTVRQATRPAKRGPNKEACTAVGSSARVARPHCGQATLWH